MKYLALAVLLICLPVFANEIRSERFDRLAEFGEELPANPEPLRHQNLNGGIPGRPLSVTISPLIESLSPFDSQPRSMAPVLDLIFESLMAPAPTGRKEILEPLIAQALRYPPNFSYVIFELNPLVHFEDGSSLNAKDVVFSLRSMLLKEENKSLQSKIAKIEETGHAVRVDLLVKGQAARDCIAHLAQTKIVRPLPNPSLYTSPAVLFYTSGPYRIGQSRAQRLSLIRDTNYWGRHLAERQGLFRFDRIDFHAFTDQVGYLPLWLNRGVEFQAFQSKTHALELQNELSERRNAKLQLLTEERSSTGRPLLTYEFNLERPLLKDRLVRKALTLIFNFDRINEQIFESKLKRPTDLMFEGKSEIKAMPSNSARSWLTSCGDELPIEVLNVDYNSYGHNLYGFFMNHEQRLATARELFVKAGFTSDAGKIISTVRRQKRPLSLRILIRDSSEFAPIRAYAKDLERLGLRVEISQPANLEQFEAQVENGDYDLVSRSVTVQDTGGWPREDLVRNVFRKISAPCFQDLIAKMSQVSPRSAQGIGLTSALMRLDQAYYLRIFAGEPKQNYILAEPRVRVPEGLPWEGLLTYGYFLP